jgi:hypothetical protein
VTADFGTHSSSTDLAMSPNACFSIAADTQLANLGEEAITNPSRRTCHALVHPHPLRPGARAIRCYCWPPWVPSSRTSSCNTCLLTALVMLRVASGSLTAHTDGYLSSEVRSPPVSAAVSSPALRHPLGPRLHCLCWPDKTLPCAFDCRHALPMDPAPCCDAAPLHRCSWIALVLYGTA